MDRGDRAVKRLVLAMFLLWVAAARAQPAPPPAAQPTAAEYQAAIRQLAAGAADDAARVAQLRMALGQIEAQRDAALARVRELESQAPLPSPPAAPAADPPGSREKGE